MTFSLRGVQKPSKAYYSWTGSRFNNKTSHQIGSQISHNFQWCSPNLNRIHPLAQLPRHSPPTRFPRCQSGCCWRQDQWWSGWRARHRSEMYQMTSGKTETEGRQIWGKKQFAQCVVVPTELWSFINQRHVPIWKYLVTLGSTSHPLETLLTFLPGLGRCSLHQPDHHTSWVQLQPDWRREGPVGGKLCESGRH